MSDINENIKVGRYTKLSDDNRKNFSQDLTDEEKAIEAAISNPFFPKKHGLYLTEDMEDLPIFGPIGDVEVVMARKPVGKGLSGARVVLTKDNFGSRATGYGGAGGTMCEAVDIVAGSLSCERVLRNSKTVSRGNFATDASRIYLTERGDIQKYFGVEYGSQPVSISSEGKAGIGIKSDHTLIIGRERVRLLVGNGNFHGGERLVNQNSNVNPKIELARTNSSDSQPAVLGSSLVSYLRKIRTEIRDLRTLHMDLELRLLEYQIALASHTHTGFGLGVVQAIPSPEAIGEVPSSVTDFFNTQKEVFIDNYNSKLEEFQSAGLESGNLDGTSEKRILSSTVYIGK